jgi:hypothetical protein
VQLESGRKNINEEAQVLNIDEKSTNNLQTIVSALNEYFLPLVEEKFVKMMMMMMMMMMMIIEYISC